jgi:flagellar biosynthesis protein FlhA
LLSIGNALVTTLPAFLISTAMGMMVTRVASDGALGADLAAQLFARPDVLRSAGALLLVLSFVPALPRPVFLVLGIVAFVLAQRAVRAKRAKAADAVAAGERAKRQALRRPELALGLIGVDAISIDVGADLTQLLVPPLADALLDRIGEVRRALAGEIGLVLPGVRLRDDLARDPQTYAIRVRDRIVAQGRLDLTRVMAVADTEVLERLGLRVEREPVYDLPAAWIEESERERVAGSGVLVFDPISIVGSHVAEIVRRYAGELLGRQELQTLLEHLRASMPALVKEIGTDAFPLGVLHRAFVYLFAEGAWPRDPVLVLQTMLEAPTRDARELAEAARQVILPDLLRRRGIDRLEPLVLDVGITSLDPQEAMRLRDDVAAYAARVARDRAAVLCGAALRPLLAELLLRSDIRLDVLSYAELPPELALAPAVLQGAPVV